MQSARCGGLATGLASLLWIGVATAQAPVVSANQQGESTEDRLARLERVVEARGESQNRMNTQLTQLLREVSELRGISEDHARQLAEVLDRQRDLYQEIERRVSEVRSEIGTAGNASSAGSVQMLPVDYSDDVGENEAYDRAINLVLEAREYDQAIPAFQSFIENFPDSGYLGNAHYWLGQLLYARGDFTQAGVHFTEVNTNYPNNNKRADSILKLGIIAAENGDTDRARRYYQQVINDFAESTEAGLARNRLADLEG